MSGDARPSERNLSTQAQLYGFEKLVGGEPAAAEEPPKEEGEKTKKKRKRSKNKGASTQEA